MKQIAIIPLTFLNLSCNRQTEKTEDVFLTVSPTINIENSTTNLIISTLTDFLHSKNNSPSENDHWLSSDFQKYVYPYLEIYNIEESKFGKDFFKPTLMEVLPTDNENRKIIKVALLGYNPNTNEST